MRYGHQASPDRAKAVTAQQVQGQAAQQSQQLQPVALRVVTSAMAPQWLAAAAIKQRFAGRSAKRRRRQMLSVVILVSGYPRGFNKRIREPVDNTDLDRELQDLAARLLGPSEQVEQWRRLIVSLMKTSTMALSSSRQKTSHQKHYIDEEITLSSISLIQGYA